MKKRKRSPRRSGINSRFQLVRGRALAICLALMLPAMLSVGILNAQKKKGDDQTRSVQGTVTTEDGAPAAGAEVQLKNTKNLQIRSYVTQKEGVYFFHGLSPDVEYELKAQYNGVWSSAKVVSPFDSKKEVTLDLKIKK
ncbi:MAG TPA: carboxypeptidase-like regulatory domain-containing protein [Bryobacteraceae bacterium]|nr:carboxypeptidase-like regulatory domain-containing protein [Bryobacteraceae bacterium]